MQRKSCQICETNIINISQRVITVILDKSTFKKSIILAKSANESQKTK